MTDIAQSKVRMTLSRAATLALTLLVLGVAMGSVVASLSLISAEADASSGEAAPVTTVAAMTVELEQQYSVIRRFTGQIEAAARADLGFELGGRVTEVLVEEGDVVPAGAVLARLDTSALIPERAALEAELAAIMADAELGRLTLARNDTLTERGVQSVAAQDAARLALARAEAGVAALRARIAGVDVRLEKSVLTAPFAAQIGARLVDPGQTAAGGQAVLVLFDTAPVRARVGLPPELAASLLVGGTVSVDVNGATLEATILQIRPDLDANTRSRSVLLTLPPGAATVLGDTVAVLLTEAVDATGFWVPVSALREGVRGSWSVMAIETTAKGDRILPAAVEVIHTEGSRVYLRGALPAGARIVAAAPDRVAQSQIVMTQFALETGE